MTILVYSIIFVNCLAFIIYGIDKRKAVKHQWRISEKALLSISFLSGMIGSIAGMVVFHHKTRKWYFWVVHIFTVILWGVIVYQIWLKPFTFPWN